MSTSAPMPTPEPPQSLAGFLEQEVELHYYDNYTSETADRKYLASCQRINNCSCNCNRCGFVVIS